VRLYTINGADWSKRYPMIICDAAKIKGSAIIDAEVVWPDSTDQVDHDQRTFECSTCAYAEVVAVKYPAATRRWSSIPPTERTPVGSSPSLRPFVSKAISRPGGRGVYLWTTMVQFKKLLSSWLMRLSQFVTERVDAMDPTWRGVLVGLISISLVCAAGLIAFPE
jgi:hypothetical protein